MCQYSDSLFAAVRILAGDGPIKKRLISAYSEHLDPFNIDEIPEMIRPGFESLRRSMHAVKPLSTEGTILASVRKMSTADASRNARQIVTMFSELVRVKATGERLRAGKTHEPADSPVAGQPSLLN
jgi:hypothetical protein